MKRMSEVFKLPVSSSAFGSIYAVSIAPGVHIATASTYAAHAINHVDALADALDACIKTLGNMPAGEPVNDSDRAYHHALEALNAYRGKK